MAEKVKNYFKKEFRFHMFTLEYEETRVSDFYLGSWQKNRSIWPLLFIRTLIFIGCVGTLVASMVLMSQGPMLGNFGQWFIFMTHWGLVFNTVSSGLAWTVSLVEFLKGPDTNPILLVKLYWAFFNSTISVAFFITAFYWSLLTGLGEEFGEADYGLDPALDIFVHGINSVMMFCLLISSRQPTRLMHFYFPLLLGIVYMVFSIIYYFAGGLSPFGTHWIYPMLDWEEPGGTALLSLGSAALIIVIHFVVVAMTLCRDALTKRCREPTVLSISGQNIGMSSNYLR